MDNIWRWAMSITIIMLSLQNVAGCSTEQVNVAVFVAVLITGLHAGLKYFWSSLKVSYYPKLLLLVAVLIVNTVTLIILVTLTPLVYLVDPQSGLVVIACWTIVGGVLMLIPPLSEEHGSLQKKKVLS